jgi:hypothetical protein
MRKVLRGSPPIGTLKFGHQPLAIKQREQAIMVRSTTKPKRVKKEETTAEFVMRINKKVGKRNGLKRQVKGARR